MKYLEVSKKINLTEAVSQEQLKQALIARLRRAFDVSDLREQEGSFHLRATTGGPARVMRHARVDLDVTVTKTKDAARVMVNGYSQVARSLIVSYCFLFLLVLLTGLLPGSISTSGEDSGAMDAMVFLVFGIFIFYDISKKLCEPKDHLQAILDSLATEYG